MNWSTTLSVTLTSYVRINAHACARIEIMGLRHFIRAFETETSFFSRFTWLHTIAKQKNMDTWDGTGTKKHADGKYCMLVICFFLSIYIYIYNLYIYIYIYTQTHTHTFIYLFIYLLGEHI